MTVQNIRQKLFDLQDVKYRDFQVKLIPDYTKEIMIGVRTPALRSLAKDFFCTGNYDVFLQELPHQFFDENQLHAFIISLIKDFDVCINEVERFLPYVDNWATCDQLSPKIFKKNNQKLLPYIQKWIQSGKTFTVRFAIGMLMQLFLDKDFKIEYANMVCAVQSSEYYVNMMRAWYFATALAKQYESVISFLTEQKMDVWTHNKTIQKAIESYRITSEQKDYLKTLKIK